MKEKRAYRALVIENNRPTAALTQRYLGIAGCIVSVTFESSKALEALDKMDEENLPDLIITSIMLPEIDGFQICERIKSDERLKNIPVLIYSSIITYNEEQQIRTLRSGADDFLSTLVDKEIFIHKVKQLLKISSQTKEIIELTEEVCHLKEEIKEKDRLHKEDIEAMNNKYHGMTMAETVHD